MSTKRNIQLLLTENVDNLGIVGDIVKVRPGYARNYLLPYGLATSPTEGNMKRLEEKRAEVERQLREQRRQLETMIANLTDREVTLKRAANEEGVLYGSVTQQDIASAVQELGFNITERDVRIGSPIKQLDSYDIPIQVADDLKTQIKVWVVSDKPAEELIAEETEEDEESEAGSEEETSEA